MLSGVTVALGSRSTGYLEALYNVTIPPTSIPEPLMDRQNLYIYVPLAIVSTMVIFANFFTRSIPFFVTLLAALTLMYSFGKIIFDDRW